ncbi:MAG: hypothetical protein NTW08_00640 [Gammaproteobacteria bacterium]|nr:hypothetical protein [Gammaproteobacteria bacterium]
MNDSDSLGAVRNEIKTKLNKPQCNVTEIILYDSGRLIIHLNQETMVLSWGSIRQKLAMIVRAVEYLRDSTELGSPDQLQKYLYGCHTIKRINTIGSVKALRTILQEDIAPVPVAFPNPKVAIPQRELNAAKKIYKNRVETGQDYLSWLSYFGLAGYSAQDKFNALDKFIKNPAEPLDPAAGGGDLSALIQSYREAVVTGQTIELT